jgi:hypothetical protein
VSWVRGIPLETVVCVVGDSMLEATEQVLPEPCQGPCHFRPGTRVAECKRSDQQFYHWVRRWYVD